MFKVRHLFQEEANPEGGSGSAGTGVTDTPSPNDNWQDNPNLDENGNPIEGKPPVNQDKPNKDKQDATPPAEPPAPVPDVSESVQKQTMKLLNESGLKVADVNKALLENDGKMTPAVLQALVKKHGEAVGTMVASSLESIFVSNKAKSQQQQNVIFDQVAKAFEGVTEQSGAESWKELSQWAKDNIPASERREINKVLAQGGKATEYAVQDLISRFKDQNQQRETQDAELMDGDAANRSGGFKPLTRQEYIREMKALEAKGHVHGQSQELARLDARRNRSIARGI